MKHSFFVLLVFVTLFVSILTVIWLVSCINLLSNDEEEEDRCVVL